MLLLLIYLTFSLFSSYFNQFGSFPLEQASLISGETMKSSIFCGVSKCYVFSAEAAGWYCWFCALLLIGFAGFVGFVVNLLEKYNIIFFTFQVLLF